MVLSTKFNVKQRQWRESSYVFQVDEVLLYSITDDISIQKYGYRDICWKVRCVYIYIYRYIDMYIYIEMWGVDETNELLS